MRFGRVSPLQVFKFTHVRGQYPILPTSTFRLYFGIHTKKKNFATLTTALKDSGLRVTYRSVKVGFNHTRYQG